MLERALRLTASIKTAINIKRKALGYLCGFPTLLFWVGVGRVKEMPEYKVNFYWDDEAQVWVATSDDIQGLILEDTSIDILKERVKMAIPELLSLNGEKQAKF